LDIAAPWLVGASTPAGRYFTVRLWRRGLVPWERSCIAQGKTIVNEQRVID